MPLTSSSQVNYASHFPKSGKCAKTIGFSGITQLIPMTAPVSFITRKGTVKIPILVSDQTPVNLLGRDALCKLGLQIWCTPDGVYVEEIGVNFQICSVVWTASVYWLGEINEALQEL